MRIKTYDSKITILISFLIVIATINQIEIVNGKNNILQYQDIPRLPSSNLLPYRQVLKSNDEGSHKSKNNFTMTQEWWYFNAYFNEPDSELKNWSIMISFNQMGIADIYFFTLYDDENISYGGSIPEISGTIQSGGPGVKVEFYNSYVVGCYPNWHIYARDYGLDENNIIVNITYKAKALPLWLLFNTGHNLSQSPAGHYCILDCEVSGRITINENTYNVHGVGYHEHSWFKFFNKQNKQEFKPRIRNPQINFQDIIDVWDWFCIHFDNGWDMFAGKFLQSSNLARFMPGSLWITPDGINITECFFFKFEYLEFIESSVESIKIPKKIHIQAIFLNMFIKNPLKGLIKLDVVIKTKNIYEHLWGDPPQYGVWEGPCIINGTISWQGHTVNLNGWSIMEITRAVS